MSNLKVYGSEMIVSPQLSEALGTPAGLWQTRTVVACTSPRVAWDAMGRGISYIVEIKNDAEVTAAMSEPGTVFFEAADGTYVSEAQAFASPILKRDKSDA